MDSDTNCTDRVLDAGGIVSMGSNLYSSIKASMIEMIEQGEFKVGEPLPPEVLLAEKFDVSRNTLRRALMELVAEEVIYRIPGKGTFLSSQHSSAGETEKQAKANQGSSDSRLALGSGLSGPNRSDKAVLQIGLVMTFSDMYTNQTIAGAERVCTLYRANLIVRNSFYDLRHEESALLDLWEHGVDGILLMPCGDFEDNMVLTRMRSSRFPYVLIGKTPTHDGEDTVTCDNFQGTYDGVTHLLENGYPKSVFVIGDDTQTYPHSDRLRGYLKAMEDNGIHECDNLILSFAGLGSTRTRKVVSRDIIIERIGHFLRGLDYPIGAVCCNDLIAEDLCEAARVEGIRVPEDLGVVGFDDREFAERLTPPLTTVHQDLRIIGEQAANQLVDRIVNGASPKGNQVIRAPLVIRESSGNRCNTVRKNS